jgi:corrinoid protein of di/trimethylamine methyltransferase
MQDLNLLHDAVLKGDAKKAKAVTESALAAGADPMKLVQDQMVPAMAEAGRKFECNEYFVPELLLSARAMKSALELIRPLLAAHEVSSAGRVVIGTVEGDLHDIGKNLVASMLEGAGYEVIDLGVNVPAARFVEVIKEKSPKVLALSALLSTTMPAMKSTVAALEAAGVRDQVKVLVGGAPVSRSYAEEIGADGYSETAAGAPALVKQVLA